MLIKISDQIGENAISYNHAAKLYDLLKKNFEIEESITIDFESVSVVSSPFLNGSIGLMLKDIEIKDLQKKIKFVNIDNHTKYILNVVIDNSLKFYKKQTF